MLFWKMDALPKSTTNILVLDNNTPEDVAKAMIEGGCQKEPFYVFDMDEVYRRIEHFKEMMPRIEIFYAMKAHDSDRMLKMIAALGLGFDCASPGEMYKILKLGVSPRSIIFAVPPKTPEWMMYARSSGVRHTTFDTSCELKKLKQYWPDVRLLIRIKVDGDSLYKLGDKFGCEYETEATDLLEEAAVLGLKVVGVAFHVGSCCSSVNSHVEALHQARALFDYEARAGRGMSIVDIGGGFYSNKIHTIDQVSKRINAALKKLFPDPSVQIIAEPGRYLCESTCTLYCNINSIRQVKRDNETINILYINDGRFGTLRYMESWHIVKKFEKIADKISDKLEKTILWGPTCHIDDRIMQNVDIMLPRCTLVDWLIFTMQGSYSYVFGGPFSSLKIPQFRYVISKNLWKKLKDSKVFDPEEFVENQDISAPLPSTLPPLTYKTTFIKSNTLKI